jgi:hypothetical protein
MEVKIEVRWLLATTRGRRARRRDNELESGKSGNVVFFARFDLVILAIKGAVGVEIIWLKVGVYRPKNAVQD